MTSHLQYLPVYVGVLVSDVEGVQRVPHTDDGCVDGNVVVNVRKGDVRNPALLVLRIYQSIYICK